MNEANTTDNIEITDEKVRELVEQVLEAEQEKLHLKSPRNITEDLEDIIREEIQ